MHIPNRSKVLILLMSAVALAATAGTASAGTTWQDNHPRRVQVNSRLARQDRRIHQERREGELTRGQARALHRDDHRIRREERAMASRDGGHLTGRDQRVLNRQENAVSGAIGR